jgi:alpha-ketoglutarate-dependent 2,4-dichlorophenoxyacetate dioxygenase
VAERTHRRIVSNIANQLWHSDSSFQRPAAKYSMLMCEIVTSWGGETEVADMRAAYDALGEPTKRALDGLEAEHYALHSRFMLGDDNYSEEQRNAVPPVTWPVVRTHPGSGRKHLFIGAHARSIAGMTVPEGRMLLADLLEHATQPQFRHRHTWRPGDLLIWDNRCVLHRGRRFDLSERRELRRATTLDVDAPELRAA